MRPRRFPTALASSLAAALVLSAVSQAVGLVICVGDDGHAGLEPILASCCAAVAVTHVVGEVELTGPPPSCGGCTDVQLETVPLRSEECPLAPPAELATGRTAAVPSPDAGRAAHALAYFDGDRHGHDLALLATVVLLT